VKAGHNFDFGGRRFYLLILFDDIKVVYFREKFTFCNHL